MRSLAIASAAVATAGLLRDFLAVRRWRFLAWTALLAPYLTPALFVSYAYSGFALSLIREPGWTALFYTALLWLKLTPVAALALYFVPPPLTSEALHCHRLLPACSAWRSLIFRARGAGRSPAIAFALVFLFAFGDFELASLWSVKTWTVAVFDAQAGGLSHLESLRLARVPVAIELLVLTVTIALVAKDRLLPVSPTHNPTGILRWKTGFAVVYLTIAMCAVTIAPVAIVFRNALSGIASLFQNFALGGEIAASLLFASGAACCVFFAARRISRPLPACLLAIPGLLGALPLSLLIVSLFQFPALRPLYDTPLPLLLALTMILLPFAALLFALLRAIQPGAALHLAAMLRHRGLIWQLKTRREFWCAFLLFSWAYFDLTASAIAAPVGMTPVFVRLHNLMHYGQTAVLSAMLCAATLAPVLLLLLTRVALALYACLRRE